MEDSSVNFLRKIFDLLNDGDVFVTDGKNDKKKALVDFKHPEELRVNN